MGRFHTLDDKKKSVLLKCVRKGLPIRHAVRIAKVTERTFYRWKGKAEEGREPYASFFEDLEAASATHALAMVDVLDKAALGGDVTTAKWLLSAVHGVSSRSSSPGQHLHHHRHEVVGQADEEGNPVLRKRLAQVPNAQLLELRRDIEAGFHDGDVLEADDIEDGGEEE